MKTEPQKEHQWLQKLVGEWTYASECSMGPDKPPEKFEGSEVMRRIAAPMVGGMVSAAVLTLVVIPAVFLLWKQHTLKEPEGAKIAIAGEVQAQRP